MSEQHTDPNAPPSWVRDCYAHMWLLLPVATAECLDRYVMRGTDPGEFMMAVLNNDLRESLGRADTMNRQCLFNTVSFLWNALPSVAWGDPGTTRKWMEMGGLAGATRPEGWKFDAQELGTEEAHRRASLISVLGGRAIVVEAAHG